MKKGTELNKNYKYFTNNRIFKILYHKIITNEQTILITVNKRRCLEHYLAFVTNYNYLNNN